MLIWGVRVEVLRCMEGHKFCVLRVLCVFAVIFVLVFLLLEGGVCTGAFESSFCEDLEREMALNLASDLVLEKFSIYICVKSVDVFARKGFGEVTISATLLYTDESKLPEDIFICLSTYHTYYFRLEHTGNGFYVFTQKNITFDLNGYSEFYPFDSYNITVEVEAVLHKVVYDPNVTKVTARAWCLYWDCMNLFNTTSVEGSVLRVKVSFLVARWTWYHFPLRLFYLFFYFALGCVSFLKTNKDEISYRLVYLSILIALFGLFSSDFSGDAPPSLACLSLYRILMICSFCSYIVFFIGSVVAYRWGGSHIVVDVIAVIVSAIVTSFSIKISILYCYAWHYEYSFRWLVWLMRYIPGAMFAGVAMYILYRVCCYGYKRRAWPQISRSQWEKYVTYVFMLIIVLMLCLMVVILGLVWLIGLEVISGSLYGCFLVSFLIIVVIVLGMFSLKRIYPEYFDFIGLFLFFTLFFFFFDSIFRISLAGVLFPFIYMVASTLLALGVRYLVYRHMLVD